MQYLPKLLIAFDQVEGLLAAGSVEEALQLAEGAQFRGGGGGQAREEVDRVRQMAGFVFLDKAEFDKAHELLIQAGFILTFWGKQSI